MALLRLSFLGTFAVQRDGVPITGFRSDKVRALLVYLAVEADRPHTRSHLAALLWPDHSAAAALNNLSQTLGRLRDTLGSSGGDPPVLLTRQSVQWNTASPVQVDAAAFLRLSQATATAPLEVAAGLYRGPFLPGFYIPGCQEFDAWLTRAREHAGQAVSICRRGAGEMPRTRGPDTPTQSRLWWSTMRARCA